MTIAITLKVNDGLVLAADSAATLVGSSPAGTTEVVNVYNNANKVFNLRKGLPIGAITWGAGSIGVASTSTLAKDLRNRLSGFDSNHPDWGLDVDGYTVEEVAERVRSFMFDELYVPTYQAWTSPKPSLGFIIAGYSAGEGMAEEYSILIDDGQCDGPTPIRDKDETGLTWQGEPEAISRLILGYSPSLGDVLQNQLGVAAPTVEPALNVIREALQASLVPSPMPIQDAIDLAEFLVQLTISFSRFSPGASTVGGPVEIAAITKHEGFKWVKRKHYYGSGLNPEVLL